MGQPSWIGYKLNGRYEVRELLGEGGMSEVYLATDPNLNRPVAVKIIHRHLSKEEGFLKRFESEASSVAQMSHPNIIQVYDFNHDHDTYYMVLEYLPGQTLQQRLKSLNERRVLMPPEEVVRIAVDVCRAADYAHRRGMVHRDVKPANVILKDDGRAVLMDFGITKMMGSTTMTGTGAVIGTAKYMAPELVGGEQADTRSDIYALGIMLYEMLSGHAPFEADSALTTLMLHVNEPVPNLFEWNPEAPGELVSIVEQALSKNPDDRQQTAESLAQSLLEANLGRTGPASKPQSALGGTVIEQPMAAEQTYLEPPQVMEDMTQPPLTVQPQQSAPPVVPPQQSRQAPPPAPAPEPVYSQPPVPPTPPPPSGGYRPGRGPTRHGRERRRGMSPLVLGGGAAIIVIILCLGIGLYAVSTGMISGVPIGGQPPVDDTPTPEETDVVTEEVPTEPVGGPTATNDPGSVQVTGEATEAPVVPTDTPEPLPTNTPAPTNPPEPYVLIEDITLSGSTYVVTYETYGFVEQLPGIHIHFFFNTVSPTQAGVPGSGPWYLYGGPRPFQGYTINDKPSGATQMCILYAYADHSVEQNTGNCYDLP